MFVICVCFFFTVHSSKSKVPVKKTNLGRKETTNSVKVEKQRTSGKDMDTEGSVLQKFVNFAYLRLLLKLFSILSISSPFVIGQETFRL